MISKRAVGQAFIKFFYVFLLQGTQTYYSLFEYNYQLSMCGICLILNIPIEQHHFNFSFFEPYNPPPNAELLPLNKHIQHYKLQLPPLPNLSTLNHILGRRGPNQMVAHYIDMYKTNYDVYHDKKQPLIIQNGNAMGFQSILHLRGAHSYVCQTPGSYFLYNGQIWDTGNLPPIDQQIEQNDGKWLHEALMGCKGSQQKILEVMGQIRGDYSFILIEGDQIFIFKDYFGKHSLLVGMGEDHLMITSAPFDHFHIKEEPNGDNGLNEEENQESWKAKYEAQWLSSKSKQLFQIPNNSMISIHLRNGQAFWTNHKIHQIDLKKIGMDKIVEPEGQIISTVKKLLVESVRQLTRCIKGLYSPHNKHDGAKIAVLFSGGIDSTLIARLLDMTLPKEQQIDLVNLAFREDAPDREAAKISFQQLQTMNPGRKYNLILLSKNLEDIEKIKKPLMQSIYPKTTHMDFNIAAALHLASAGTKAKIVLTGLGADQIFSGYSRYRIAYKRAGYEQMENEMIFDMERLWIRNLGRDDRAIGMNGKEARFPFLYYPLWEYLRRVPLNKITEGNGQKMLLRKIARQFGLEKASQFKKKAIQFGTRLAKLSNVKSFGSNRKAKGTYEYR